MPRAITARIAPVTQVLIITLTILTGWGSQYRPGIMPEVVANRQAGRAIPMLPQELPRVTGFVAWPYCEDVGQVVELRIEGGPWGRYLIADCPHDLDTQRWMLGNDILVEFSGETARRRGFVGRGVRVERRITTTRNKDFSFLKGEHDDYSARGAKIA